MSIFFRFPVGHLPHTSGFHSANKYFSQLSVNTNIIFGRLESILQNFHESRCRKLLGIQWHINPFDESKDEEQQSNASTIRPVRQNL